MRAGRFRSVASTPQEPFAFVDQLSPGTGQRAYSSALPISQFSYGTGSFEKVFASTSNLWYVDKTDYIPKLEALNASAIVSLRPRRMGKTLFKDTLAHYYDVVQKDEFEKLFGHLEIGKRGARTPLANTFYVLPLTFAGLKTDTVEKFETSLNDELNDSCAAFKKRYNLSFEINEQNSLSTFRRLEEEVKRKKEKLYVMIDEYDVSINKALSNSAFVAALQVTEGGGQNPLQRMENIYAEFFSKLKTACDENVARCFITGVTPLALNEFTSGFNIATHITNDLRFASLYGFAEADVKDGLARLKLSETVVAKIVESWRYNHNGYLFDPRQKVALYNPTRVLHGLRQLEQALQVDPPPSTLQPEEVVDHLLSRILDDDNSMPSEATLRAIASNPNASLVIADALSSDSAELDCGGGVKGQFRLSHMNELATDRKPLLSFMFYNGALTYAPSTSVKLKHSLRIPNNVARMEFAKELEQMIGLKEGGYDKLREAIITMLDTKKLDSFCEAVSKYLLGGLAGRDIVGGEDPFAQAVYDALSLARRPTDSVEKEYKVDPAARTSKSKGFAMDVVYVQPGSTQPQCCYKYQEDPARTSKSEQIPRISDQPGSTQPQYYCLSLKNVRVQALELAKTEDGKIQDNWEKLCEISRRGLDDEKKVSDEEILALPLNVAFMKQYKKGDTVRTVLENAVQEAQRTHLPPLRKEIGQANVHCWVLVRVGMKRIIWKQVTV